MRRLLEAAGVRGRVSQVGTQGEIIAVRGVPAVRERLAEVAPEIRALGYQYVALELSSADHDDEDS